MASSNVFKTEKEINEKYAGRVGFIGKVFLYLFLGILLSSVVCVALSYIMFNVIAQGDESLIEDYLTGYLVIMGISGIGVIVLSLITSIKGFRAKNIMVPYLIYASLMGVLLSTFTIFTGSFYLIGTALAITSVIFLVCMLLSFITGGRLHWAFSLLIGLAITGILLVLFNIFLLPLALTTSIGQNLSYEVFYTLELVTLGMIVLVTFIDFSRINTIAQSGGDRQAAQYCAYALYCDFVAILIRIIWFLIRTSGRSKR